MTLDKYIYAHCQNPITINIYNGVLNAYVPTEVPCGKCYHCKITKINEWVTRMVATALYNKYVYFGTLTYNGRNETKFHEETLPSWSNDNKTKKYNYAPCILRKDHLQKFFKRLRKNTGIKFQYCACGEYGSTYGRPHYHYIMFSNEPITSKDIKFAWTAKNSANKRKSIGRIDHQDLKNTSTDVESAYKYVCKYIQKSDFNFEELPNINHHFKTYKKEFNYYKQLIKNQKDYENLPNYLRTKIEGDNFKKMYTSDRLDDYLMSKNIESFEDYQDAFSPFFIASKSPAIGYQYYKDSERRFQKANFTLHGMSDEYIFPLYFIRKTKESLCPVKMQSTTNNSYCSFSRVPKVVTLLDDIINAHNIAESTEQIVQTVRRYNNSYIIESRRNINDLQRLDYNCARLVVKEYLFDHTYLSFMNTLDHVYYSFRLDCYAKYKYNPKSKLFEFIGHDTLENVKHLINYYYEKVKNNILLPFLEQSKVSANQKESLIKQCGGIDNFNELKSNCLKSFNNHINDRQNKYKLTKTFE